MVLTLYALVFLYPIYASGDPSANYRLTFRDNMNKLTIANVTDNDGKMVFAYFSAVFIIPIWAFVALWYYRKTKTLNSKLHKKEFNDVTIAEQSVLVTNLPKNMNGKKLEGEMTTALNKIFSGKAG
jgi:hypothetical protein